MAFLQHDKRTGRYQIRFRFQGLDFKRSTKTNSEKEARLVLQKVDETILLLERGRLQLPPGVDPADFILSDGRQLTSRIQKKTARLKGLFHAYSESIPEGAKEKITLKGEKVHKGHFLRLIGGQTVVTSITTETLQDYISARSKEKSPRGGTISPDTIRKETTTFRLIWNWAERNELVSRRSPTQGLQYHYRSRRSLLPVLHAIRRSPCRLRCLPVERTSRPYLCRTRTRPR